MDAGPFMNHSNRFHLLRSLAARWKRLATLLLVTALAASLWWFYGVSLRFERFYQQAREQYNKGELAQAVTTLEQAWALNPDVVRVNILLGWSHWKLEQPQRAEFYFARAHRLDPSVEEAKMGLALASLALRKSAVALPLLQELASQRPDTKEIQMSLGEAYVLSGQNVSAASTYRAWMERHPEDPDARREFLALFGYPEYRPDLPAALSPPPRAAQLEIYARTRGEYFQIRVGEVWNNFYVAGVNIGPARPGEFPSTASRNFSTYLEWLQQIAAMNANTVRVYTVLPPAFYQAFKVFNETARSPLWLIQEVWIDDEAENLYDPATEQEFQSELTYVIDLLHGHGDLRYRRGHNFGIYTADVSRYVLALGVGREVEPRLILTSNSKNPTSTTYQGRYVSLEQGNPAEAWFARMCDFAVRYEVENYNGQHPLTVVNWPPLDPLTHPTESTYEEEMRIRKSLGEAVPEELPPIINDADVVSLDIMKFKMESEFGAGLFALYHVYPHWPDFLLYEPSYALARDAEGPNRYLGYLRELKKAHPHFPLLIGEYGMSTSLASAHLHPQGWNNGGLTEKQQAELLVRFTKNIRETGYAGSVVFEWLDEWFKHVHDSYTAEFEQPWERNPLWMNALDPEKNFGIVGYEPVAPVPLLRGEPADWQGAQPLYSLGGFEQDLGTPPGELRAVSAYSDFAYFYLRLDIKSGALDWDSRNYWIALNTLPAGSGSQLLPEIGVRVESGANFLIQLAGLSSSQILIAENYNPNEEQATPGRPGLRRLARKKQMKVELADFIPFQEIRIEANLPRYARDGRIFPSLPFSRSPLPFGTGDRTKPEFSSHALWYADPQKGMVELRLPWGLLLLMDPSNGQAFGGTDEQWTPVPRPSPGISVAVFALRVPRSEARGPKVVTSSLPPVRDGKVVGALPLYTWPKWNHVDFRPYFKQGYFALQRAFAEVSKPLRELPANPPRLSRK